MLAQELGLLQPSPQCGPGGYYGLTHSCEGLPVRPIVPTVCEQAYLMLQTTGLRLLGVAQAGFPPEDGHERGDYNSEVLSLTSFLDEDIPKFPFARSQHSAATWTRVTT